MPRIKLPFKEFTWTPELAYVVGLLVTDGNLSKDGRHINMRSSDRDLLKTFICCLQIKNNKIGVSHGDGYSKKPCYRVQLSNVQLYNWLTSIGIKPAKTYTIAAINLPDTFFRDFLRGHLDGDGSIFTYRDTYNIYKGKRYINTRIYTSFISASKKHIAWLHATLVRNSPVKGVIIHRPGKDSRADMWQIKIAKYESLKLFPWLYYKKNLPALKRKRQLAERLLMRVRNNKLIR
ncbi:MAG: hypothetical protein AAB533_01045 [Patescibacteria group bacterium]